MIHANPLSNGFDPAMRKGTLTQCEPQIPSHMCKFQVRLLLLWHKAFPGSSLSTVKGTGPENYIFKGYWVSLESSIMPVFSAEPKLFLTEFGTDHALDGFKSIFSHNRTTLTFLRCSDASGTLVTLMTWSWETTLSEWYGDITPTKDPPRQWGKILILCQPLLQTLPKESTKNSKNHWLQDASPQAERCPIPPPQGRGRHRIVQVWLWQGGFQEVGHHC